MKLQDAAEYVRTSKASKTFINFIQILGRVFTFTEERSNRLARYVQITRAYKSGQPIEEILAVYGCSRQTILRYARMAGLPKRPKHFPIKIRNDVIADYKTGMEIAKIAKLHNVSPAYVSKIAREEDISRYEPRPKRKRSV